MKYYTINVNGNTYEVSVEETNGFSQPAMVKQPTVTPVQPVAPTVAAPTVAPPKPQSSPSKQNTVGSLEVNSPMPGKILGIKANVGDVVKKGDVILILEAMKMENEIVSPSVGTVASINVTSGQTVVAGDLLATLNEA
jgi:biotin carboxyl carrier protein